MVRVFVIYDTVLSIKHYQTKLKKKTLILI